MSRATARRDVRHSRRRARPGLSASRERDRPKRMLPRQAAGEVLAAQRPDAGCQRGRQGRRARQTRSAPGGSRATSCGQDQQIDRRQRPSASCSSAIRPKRFASFCSPRTTAARSTTARSCLKRRREAWRRFTASSSATSGSPARILLVVTSRQRGARANSMPARMTTLRRSRRRFGRASSKPMDDDFNTGGASRPVRSGPRAQQVRRCREARSTAKPTAAKLADVETRNGDVPRAGGDARFVSPGRSRPRPAAATMGWSINSCSC